MMTSSKSMCRSRLHQSLQRQRRHPRSQWCLTWLKQKRKRRTTTTTSRSRRIGWRTRPIPRDRTWASMQRHRPLPPRTAHAFANALALWQRHLHPHRRPSSRPIPHVPTVPRRTKAYPMQSETRAGDVRRSCCSCYIIRCQITHTRTCLISPSRRWMHPTTIPSSSSPWT